MSNGPPDALAITGVPLFIVSIIVLPKPFHYRTTQQYIQICYSVKYISMNESCNKLKQRTAFANY